MFSYLDCFIENGKQRQNQTQNGHRCSRINFQSFEKEITQIGGPEKCHAHHFELYRLQLCFPVLTTVNNKLN